VAISIPPVIQSLNLVSRQHIAYEILMHRVKYGRSDSPRLSHQFYQHFFIMCDDFPNGLSLGFIVWFNNIFDHFRERTTIAQRSSPLHLFVMNRRLEHETEHEPEDQNSKENKS